MTPDNESHRGGGWREQARVEVLQSFTALDAHDSLLRRVAVLGYLRGTVYSLTPEDHVAATRGALDALDEIEEPPTTTTPTEGVRVL